MTKTYTLKNDIIAVVNGVEFTVPADDNPDIDMKSSTVTLNVVLSQRVSKSELHSILIGGPKRVNKLLFKGVIDRIVRTETKAISTGGGHNEPTTYDSHSEKLIVYGTIVLDSTSVKSIIDLDKDIKSKERDLKKIEKELKLLENKIFKGRQELYKLCSSKVIL